MRFQAKIDRYYDDSNDVEQVDDANDGGQVDCERKMLISYICLLWKWY